MAGQGRSAGLAAEDRGMGIDLSDLDRLEGIAEALGRLFWCLIALAFLTAVLGSAGTGFLLLVLGGASLVGRLGLKDFVDSRREPARTAGPDERAAKPEVTVYRARRARRPKSTV